MIEKFRRKLNLKLGEHVYLSALRDVALGVPATTKPDVRLFVLSLLVLSTPFVCLGVGLALIAFDFPNVITGVLGGTFCAMAWVLRPRKAQLPTKCLDRSDLPILVELLDQISDHMGAPKVDKISLTAEFNAFAGIAQGQHILGLGSFLWLASNDTQKLALLAHEVAHLANKDVQKNQWGYKALAVLEGLLDLAEPPVVYYVDLGVSARESQGVIADGINATFRLAIEVMMLALLKLMYVNSQKAEYRADANSAAVAGREAVLQLLDLTVFVEPTERRRVALWPHKDEAGLALSQRFADTVFELSADERRKVLSNHEEEVLSVDATHPPTRYRKAFVMGLPDSLAGTGLSFGKWAALEAELAPHFERLGDDMREYIRER
ncbi:hypothetical protein NBRC116594_38840 [Shimia sp. NS0008-38b]